jgi:hypothetical protein
MPGSLQLILFNGAGQIKFRPPHAFRDEDENAGQLLILLRHHVSERDRLVFLKVWTFSIPSSFVAVPHSLRLLRQVLPAARIGKSVWQAN